MVRVERAALPVDFMVSLSNHEGLARRLVRRTSWFDKLTMKRWYSTELRFGG